MGGRRTECGEKGQRGGRGHRRTERPEPSAEAEQPRERQGDGRQRRAVRARTNMID